MKFKIHIGDTVSVETFDLQDHFADLCISGREGLDQLTADHVPDQLFPGCLGRVDGGNVLSVPKHAAAIRNLEDFLHTVGYVDDGRPLRLHPADVLHQDLDLRVGQRGCRFVHDQDLGLFGDGLRDLDKLHVGDRESVDPCFGINVHSEPREQLTGLADHGSFIDKGVSRSLPDRFSDENVLIDRKLRRQIEFLINHLHAVAAVLRQLFADQFLSLQQDAPLVCLDRSGDTFDDRRFACAVFTDQRMHLSLPEFQ